MKQLLLLLLLVTEICGDGMYSALSLSYPFGVRLQGMGETGYALADDESALFYNPAGLALKNDRWNGGAVCASKASFFMGDIPDRSYAAVYQNSRLNKFGLSVYLNHWTWQIQEGYIGSDGTLKSVDLPSDYEFVGAVGGGYTVFSNGVVAHSIGGAMKYYSDVNYYLNGSDPVDIMQNRRFTVSFDVGYLAEFFNHVRVGIVLKNMGPAIREVTEDSLSWRSDQPLILATGFGYKDVFGTRTTAILDLAAEVSYSHLIVDASRENTLAAGIELQLFRTWAFRFGYNFSSYSSSNDFSSSDYSYFSNILSLGTGIRLFNHFEADVYMALNTDTSPDRAGASLTFTRALNWKRSDTKWWLRNDR